MMCSVYWGHVRDYVSGGCAFVVYDFGLFDCFGGLFFYGDGGLGDIGVEWALGRDGGFGGGIVRFGLGELVGGG